MSRRKQTTKKKRTKKAARAPSEAADQKLAGVLRARMVGALAPVCDILNDARAAGLSMNFDVAPGAPDGLHHVNGVIISRVL